ncbi:MAG: hypothetical protein H0X17_03380, partial [Deltaproteobacteria bacterium]|nr:hypothetical protein [Deltaproteobacteria bacterium]
NALAATVFPVLLLCRWGFPSVVRWRGWLLRTAVACGIWLGVTAGAFGTNALLTDRQMHLWHSSLAVMDIVGTLRFSESDSTDSSLRRALAGTTLRIDQDIHRRIRASYVPAELLHLVYGETRIFDLPLVNAREPAPVAIREAVEAAWSKIVLGRPAAYLRYRLDTFRVVLGFDDAAWERTIIVTHPYQNVAALEEHGIPVGYSRLQGMIGEGLDALSHTPLFKPYLYLVLALGLLVLARRQRDVCALLLSGLGLQASLLLLAHSPDYRYSHWMICATLLAAIVVVARRREPHPL